MEMYDWNSTGLLLPGAECGESSPVGTIKKETSRAATLEVFCEAISFFGIFLSSTLVIAAIVPFDDCGSVKMKLSSVTNCFFGISCRFVWSRPVFSEECTIHFMAQKSSYVFSSGFFCVIMA